MQTILPSSLALLSCRAPSTAHVNCLIFFNNSLFTLFKSIFLKHSREVLLIYLATDVRKRIQMGTQLRLQLHQRLQLRLQLHQHLQLHLQLHQSGILRSASLAMIQAKPAGKGSSFIVTKTCNNCKVTPVGEEKGGKRR